MRRPIQAVFCLALCVAFLAAPLAVRPARACGMCGTVCCCRLAAHGGGCSLRRSCAPGTSPDLAALSGLAWRGVLTPAWAVPFLALTSFLLMFPVRRPSGGLPRLFDPPPRATA